MMHGDRERVADAVRFALDAHGDQTRKGTTIPYASHLLQVAGLVLEHGGDGDQAVAAVLHDAIEDCADVDASQIRSRFGIAVAEIVEACTDTLPGDRPDAKSLWSQRKRGYVERVGAANARIRLVAACDKLHNLRTLIADLRVDGIATLDRFTATPTQLRWYHEAVGEALGRDLPARLRDELDALIEALRELVPHATPAPADSGPKTASGD